MIRSMTCKGKTKTGAKCGMPALKGESFCFTHSPKAATRRAQAHKLGGARTRVGHGSDGANIPDAIRTIAQAMTVLDYVLKELLQLENSLQRSRALIALVGGYVDAVKVGELEARMIAIESALRTRPDGTQ